MCVLPTASVTWGAARGRPVQVGCKTGSEDWAVQNCAFCKMQIIASGSLAWKMWCVGEMALALGLLEANLAWPSPCLFFFLCSCCFRRPRQGASCWWAFPVVHLGVKSRASQKMEVRGSPFSSPGSSPLRQLREAYSSAHEASSVREPALVSSQGSLGTSCLGSPRAPALVPGKKAQHDQKSGQGATERGSLQCEAASAGPQAKCAAFWPTTVRRCVPPPGSPVQPQTSMSSEVAFPSPLFPPVNAAVGRCPPLFWQRTSSYMQVFAGESMIWRLLFNFPRSCHHSQVSLFMLGALQLYKPWSDICECVAALSSEPAAQPSISATHLSSQIHWLVLTTYSTPMKGTICHFFSCLKAMIPGRNLRKSVPLPCSPSLLFSSQMSPFLNYRISSLFNTTYSPHVFWKCKISLCVCLQLSLFTHYSQTRLKAEAPRHNSVSVGFIS
nr:uncharacterized protein LOC123863125 [Mirounga angustirostris]